MKEIALNINNVSKAYRLPDNNIFWALKDVSLEVKKGEILGVIGHNGCGKSTLLRILSNIVQPTKGSVELYDTATSILEVGSGFHPDLTGRENILMYGRLLGMSKHDVVKNIDEIIRFSELETFIDIPVKSYSSGMYLRLALSVAIQSRVPLLFIDEVLSAGDESFRKKILKKVTERFSARGTTVVLVSHNMTEIAKTCSRCIVLKQGSIAFDGKANDAVNYYIETTTTEKTAIETQSNMWQWEDINSAPGNNKIKICSFKITPKQERSHNQLYLDDEIEFSVEFWKLIAGTDIQVSVLFSDKSDIPVFCATSVFSKSGEKLFNLYKDKTGLFRIQFIVPAYFFAAGLYFCQIRFDENHSNEIFVYDKNLLFKIYKNPNKEISGLNSPILHPPFEWNYTKVE